MICNVEVWRTIDNYPDYQVSNKGRVRSWKNRSGRGARPNAPRLLKLTTDKKGYQVVGFSDGKHKKQWFVHKAVLTAFVGPRPDGMECCHGDGNRANNCLENLRWDTKIANEADRAKHGTDNKGERHGRAKLTETDVLAIVKDQRLNQVIAEDYGVSHQQIHCIKVGKLWSHSTGIKYQPKRRKVNV